MLSPSIGLPAVNFFMADIGGGMGPFLSTWLTGTEHWQPDRIGFVLSAGLFAGMLLATPAGALIDRIGRPRAMLTASCLMIMCGTLALLLVHGLWPVVAAQVLVASGALGGPALIALTMATIGKDGFPRQQGINQAATHAGNVVAAALVWLAALVIGAVSSIAVLGVMATGMLIVLAFYPRDAVDHTRMAGRERRKPGEKRGSTRALLRNRRLLVVIFSIGLFNFGRGAVLPLLGQRLASEPGHNATQWMAALVIIAQAVMIPASWVAGHACDRTGRRALMIAACLAQPLRGLIAAISAHPVALVAVEVLDGMAAGLISVAGPAAIADMTYGGGRTQTAMGAQGTVQSFAAAASAWVAGVVVVHFGWVTAFGVLALAPLGAVALMLFVPLADQPAQPAGASAAAAE